MEFIKIILILIRIIKRVFIITPIKTIQPLEVAVFIEIPAQNHCKTACSTVDLITVEPFKDLFLVQKAIDQTINT